jgi:CDP-glycerol glycerophosphotransferase
MKVIQATGCNFILKLHDHPHLPGGTTRQDLLRHARKGLKEHGRLEDHSDVAPLLAAADLLVSDASSVAYEFAILNRPIVFIDVPELLARRAADEGSNMDIETHGRSVGRLVASAEELGAAIQDELKSPDAAFARSRRETAAHVFYDPGRAARRAADKLLSLAGVSA